MKITITKKKYNLYMNYVKIINEIVTIGNVLANENSLVDARLYHPKVKNCLKKYSNIILNNKEDNNDLYQENNKKFTFSKFFNNFCKNYIYSIPEKNIEEVEVENTEIDFRMYEIFIIVNHLMRIIINTDEKETDIDRYCVKFLLLIV